MLYFLPSPIGNLGDISCRTLEILQTCDIIFAEDVRVCKALLFKLGEKYKLDFPNFSFYSLHSHNEAEFDFSKIDFSKTIAYLSDAGMPCISDPGRALVEYAIKNDLEYYVLPGANALLTALAASGFSDKEFVFLGFLNIKKNRQAQIENALKQNYTTVLYEAPTRIAELVSDIAKIDSEKELFLIKEISKMHETKFIGKAGELAKRLKSANLKGEWVVVIKNEAKNIANICESDILELDINAKSKAKLLSKINALSVKENYENLIKK